MLPWFQEENIAVRCTVSLPNTTTTRIKADEMGKVPRMCLMYSRVCCTYAPLPSLAAQWTLFFSYLLSVQYCTLRLRGVKILSPNVDPPHYNILQMLNMFFSSAHGMFTKKDHT